jgi:hypothetical protein
VDRAGPFDPELFGPEDYDLWLRCAAGGCDIQRQLTGYRDTASGLGKQAETMRWLLRFMKRRPPASGPSGGAAARLSAH